MTLDQMTVGQTAVITVVGGQGALRRHLLDMGLTPRTTVSVTKIAPLGDPIELHLRGYQLSIRKEDASQHPGGAEGGEIDHGIPFCTGRQSELRQDDPF